MTKQYAAKRIRQIDRQLSAITDELLSLEKIDQMSAQSWQEAWDRHPDMWRRHYNLYCLRGMAQLSR